MRSASPWTVRLVAGLFVLLALVVAHDQLLVEYGDHSAYWLGKATPAVTWILTAIALFLTVAFLRRLWRTTEQKLAAGVTVVMLLSFLAGWGTTRNWSLEWLVEGDIEVTLDRDEYLEVVVGIWAAFWVALVAQTILGLGANQRQVEVVEDA